MRLICELCAERGLAAIINIHDVALAQMFVQRVIGLRLGAIVFDGTARRPDAGGADHDLRRGGLGGDRSAKVEDEEADEPRCRA